MAGKKSSEEIELLKKENEELKKKLAEIESMLTSIDENESEEGLQEIENPYTVTNRAISELVSPKDTMYYLSSNQITLILTAFEIAKIPTYFEEEPVNEIAEFAEKLKRHLVSKNGRGRRDILRVLRVSSGQVRENVQKSLFRHILKGGTEEEVEGEE